MIIATASQPSFYELLTVGIRYKRAILTAFLVSVDRGGRVGYSAQKLYQADSKVIVRAGREYVPVLETGDRNAMPPTGTMQEAIEVPEWKSSPGMSWRRSSTRSASVGLSGIGRCPAAASDSHLVQRELGQSWPLKVTKSARRNDGDRGAKAAIG